MIVSILEKLHQKQGSRLFGGGSPNKRRPQTPARDVCGLLLLLKIGLLFRRLTRSHTAQTGTLGVIGPAAKIKFIEEHKAIGQPKKPQ
jgi:hypothetical protein